MAFRISDNLETLFKVEPPFTEVKDGFGYVGVVLSDKTTGNLQCHICGNYFEHLSCHVSSFHKMKSRDYRIKYQLPLGFPLCSKSRSEKLRENSQHNNWEKHLPSRIGRKYKGKYTNNAKYGRNNSSFHNKYGLCELQMERRYLLVADLLGKDPSELEIKEHDPKLLWAIKNKYKTSNAFKDKLNIPVRQSYRPKDNVLELKNGNPYKIFDHMKKKDKKSLIGKYGSINRAVNFIGLSTKDYGEKQIKEMEA